MKQWLSVGAVVSVLASGLAVPALADSESPDTLAIISSEFKSSPMVNLAPVSSTRSENTPRAVTTQTNFAPVLFRAPPSSAPRKIAVASAANTVFPDRARIRLTWAIPVSRYGAEIVGYRIQYSSASGAPFKTLIANTGSKSRRAILSDGIRAGVSYSFRVRAITNDGSGIDTVGSASSATSIRVRTAPKAPVLVSTTRVGPGIFSYYSQSLSDRGGFAKSQVRYSAVATSAEGESIDSFRCNETRCRFPDLEPETIYQVVVTATNPLGSTGSDQKLVVDDEYFGVQWYLNGQSGISMPAAWRYSRGDSHKVVAVIDTGIKPHEQLDAQLTRNPDGSIYGYDFVSNVANSGDGDGVDSDPTDPAGGNFHGTNVAGIIAAAHDTIGTAGVAPKVKILPIRALGVAGGVAGDVVEAIRWAAGEKLPGIPKNKFPASVINLSLGAQTLESCDTHAEVFSRVTAKGISIVAAAGNEGRGSLSFPANCPGVIAVAATSSLGDRAIYSNFGEGVLLSAPGGDESVGSAEAPLSRGLIITTGVDGSNIPGYVLSGGTSMAAPIVAGVVALMYSMHPNITPARVRTILTKSVKPFAAGSNCSISGGCGAGIVNAQMALARTSALR